MPPSPRAPFAHALQRGAAGPVDAGQAKAAHVAAQRAPVAVRLRPSGAAALAHRRAFVDPGPAAVAIDAGGGEIARPARGRGGDRCAMAGEDRIGLTSGRNGREDMARLPDGGGDGAVIVKGERVGIGAAPHAGDAPAVGAQTRGQPGRGIAHADDKHVGHGATAAGRQTVKLSPQPQLPLALGLLKTKPAVKSSSTQSIVDPTRYRTDAPSM